MQECVLKILTSDVCVYMMPSFVFGGYRGSFPGVEWRGHDVDHSSLSSAEVKNEGTVPLLPLYSPWHGQGQLFLMCI